MHLGFTKLQSKARKSVLHNKFLKMALITATTEAVSMVTGQIHCLC